MLNDSRDSAFTRLGDHQTAARADEAEAFGRSGSSLGRSAGGRFTGAGAASDAAIQTEIWAAVRLDDRSEGTRRLAALLDQGVTVDALIETHIPEVARAFGEAWTGNSCGFSDVTIAVARLQGWLRELEDQRPDAPFDLAAPEVLIVLPDGSQHTLGAMTATAMFRREGALARLAIGQSPAMVGHLVRTHHFDLVAISATSFERLDFLANLINCIRSGIAPTPPIVLGGEILKTCPDAPALVGADFATSDPKEALTLCGLSTLVERDGPVAPRSMRPKEHPRGVHMSV